MWSPEPTRRAALALLGSGLATGLASCGFAPVYGTPGGGALDGAVRVAEPDTEFGFAFVRRFEERLGRASAPRYDLAYAIAMTDTALAIDGSNRITRYNVEGRLDWTLVPVGGGDPVLRARETAFTAFSASGSTISSFESERDARRRLAIVLADKVVTRVLAEASALTP